MEGIVLDPEEFAENRVELSLSALGLDVRQEGADWGESAIEAQLARASIGSVVTDRHLEPVEMSIPIMVHKEGTVSLAEAAHKLEQKVSLFQRESGGWIRRDFNVDGGFAGSVAYQVLKGSLSGMQGWLMAHRQHAPDVTLKLLRSPLCYATVETESEVFESETGARELIFTLAEVLGTAPGLIRVKVTLNGDDPDINRPWRGLIFAGETRDMAQDETGDTTAYPAYDAADLTLEGGSKVVEVKGVKVVENAELTAGWLSILNSEITREELGHMTHVGVRRLYLRAEDPGETAEDVQLKLRWRILGSTQWSENRIVPLSVNRHYQIYDLGETRPEAAALGDKRWEWELEARSLSGAGKVRVQRVWPLPTEQFCITKTLADTSAADAQSAKSPGTVEETKSGASTSAWSSPNNVKASDNSYASVELKAVNDLTYLLKVSNFGFALPGDSQIRGIILGVERSVTGGTIRDFDVRLIKAGNLIDIANSKALPDGWPISDAYAYYGASNDQWGESWLPSDINSSGFGAAIQCFGGVGTAQIDHMQVIVYYSEADEDNYVCFAERSIELRTDGIYRQHPSENVWGAIIPEGFLPYASPSGLEGRKSRFIVIPTQGDLGEHPDSGTNAVRAQALTRPAYLFAREAI